MTLLYESAIMGVLIRYALQKKKKKNRLNIYVYIDHVYIIYFFSREV